MVVVSVLCPSAVNLKGLNVAPHSAILIANQLSYFPSLVPTARLTYLEPVSPAPIPASDRPRGLAEVDGSWPGMVQSVV